MDSELTSSTWSGTPEEFCAALKAARIRQGLSLAEISQATKITESHFVALERGDLRHWPKGIFRRAFFSAYVRAIGVPLEPALATFSRLFPDPAAVQDAVATDAVKPSVHQSPAADPVVGRAELRLALASVPLIPRGALARARLAAADAAFVVAAGAAGAWALDQSVAAAVAVTAVSYYSAAAIVGRPHPVLTLLRHVGHGVRTMPAVPALRAARQIGAVTFLNPSALRDRLPKLQAPLDMDSAKARVNAAVGVVRGLAERLKGIDLERLRSATPQVLERLKRVRTPRPHDRPMARSTRPESNRPGRRRQDPNGVKVRIRLTR
jgi:hypothetical protein